MILFLIFSAKINPTHHNQPHLPLLFLLNFILFTLTGAISKLTVKKPGRVEKEIILLISLMISSLISTIY